MNLETEVTNYPIDFVVAGSLGSWNPPRIRDFQLWTAQSLQILISLLNGMCSELYVQTKMKLD